MEQTHASNHPVTATATETHSKQSKGRGVVERKVGATMTAQHSKAKAALAGVGGVWRWFIKTRASGVGRRPGAN